MLKLFTMFASILKKQEFVSVEKFEGQPRDDKGRFSHAWQQISGKKGSNKGGVHEFHGEKYYAKFPPSRHQVKAEVVADKIHELLGCKTLQHQEKDIKGQTASVTKWNDGLKPLGYAGWKTLEPKQKQQAADIFMASALTKNYDVVGLTYDNMCKDKNGDLHIVDTGGSFTFRAMGGYKPFDNSVNTEIDNFLSLDKTSGRVFKPIYDEHPDMFRNAAAKLKNITKEQLQKIVYSAGMKDAGQVVDTLMNRRKLIMERFGV